MMPFDGYPGGERTLIEPRKPPGDGTCRHDYCLEPLEWCRMRCAYCGRRLDAPYESWLALSVDHVIPTRTIRERNYPADWVGNRANVVACCRACNEFLNGYRVTEPAPKELCAFFDLRDKVFREKQEHALKRHEQEQQRYTGWREGSAQSEASP